MIVTALLLLGAQRLFDSEEFMISQNETGNYTRLSFEILFERSASWTVMTVMVPYTMLIIIAWFTYWLHPKV